LLDIFHQGLQKSAVIFPMLLFISFIHQILVENKNRDNVSLPETK